MTPNPHPPHRPNLLPSFLLLTAVLLASTIQSIGAQIVQTTHGYRAPYLLLWLSHSSFVILLPAHLLGLRWFSSGSQPTGTLFRQLTNRLKRHAGGGRRLVGLIAKLTTLATLPAASWYAAVPLTNVGQSVSVLNLAHGVPLTLSLLFSRYYGHLQHVRPSPSPAHSQNPNLSLTISTIHSPPAPQLCLFRLLLCSPSPLRAVGTFEARRCSSRDQRCVRRRLWRIESC